MNYHQYSRYLKKSDVYLVVELLFLYSLNFIDIRWFTVRMTSEKLKVIMPQLNQFREKGLVRRTIKLK